VNEPEAVATSVNRAELAARAAGQAQRNRPRMLLVLGAVVLLGGLVWMLVGRSALASANAERRGEINTASSVLMQKARLERHIRAAEQGGGELEPVRNFTTIAENAATSVGLTPSPSLTRQSEDAQGELIVRSYQYERVTSRDLEALIAWVTQVESMVPGVEIGRFELKPSRTQWQLAITFVKPELSS